MAKVACFGEILLRFSPPTPLTLLQASTFGLWVGGAEANVAVALSSLGHDAHMVSVLPDNELATYARRDLAREGVSHRHVATGQGRMGLYFLDPSSGARVGHVTYDRCNSAFVEGAANIDFAEALAGSEHLHFSGITPALSRDCADAALKAVRTAGEMGLTISFDGNYREALWSITLRAKS